MIEETVFYIFCTSLCMGLGALSVCIWAVLDDQMDDTEGVKYRILNRELCND